jgi:hypothetical protein
MNGSGFGTGLERLASLRGDGMRGRLLEKGRALMSRKGLYMNYTHSQK